MFGVASRRACVPGRSPDRIAAALSLLYAATLYAIFSSLPLFGDAIGYAHRTAEWIAQSGMHLFPAGSERGAQGMGHPSAYFWIWALLMRILGDTIQVAHLMPAFFTGLAVFATWLLVSRVAGRAAGLWAAVALAGSPLFLAQAMQPLQDIPFAAFSALSLWSYSRGRDARAAAWCAAAVMCREQALVLAFSYVAVEILYSGLRRIPRLLLYSSPILVMAVTGFGNLLTNGYFFMPGYVSSSTGLEQGWLADRIRLFAGHLYAGNGRWILVASALAAGLTRVSRGKLPVASVLMLLSPAVLYPPGRLLWLLAAAFAGLVLLLRKGELPDRTGLVLAVFPSLMVAFHVLIVLVSADSDLNLFRYLLGAYPAFLAGCLILLRREGGVRAVHLIGGLLAAFSFLSGNVVAEWWQPDVSQAYLALPYAEREMIREAAVIGDTIVIPSPDLDVLTRPGLGYASSPLPAIPLESGTRLSGRASGYTILIPMSEHYIAEYPGLVRSIVPDGFGLDTVSVWKKGLLRLTLLHAGPQS
jgi:4-amino-4-deoxy-L-arabinose transferase-like glycosyltransferase